MAKTERANGALLGDVPVGEKYQDRLERIAADGLERANIAGVLARAAVASRHTLTIGVFGDWGRGKTSLMRLIKQGVDSNTRAVGVWFNAWQYEREDHLIVPLIATITKALDAKLEGEAGAGAKLVKGLGDGARALRKALRAVAYGFSFKGKVDIPLLGGGEINFSAKDMIERYQKLTDEYQELAKRVALDRSLYFDAFEQLEQAASGTEDTPKIVVFIDDLDRCLPDAAVMLLENIKLVLSLPNFSFVLGLAPNVIQKFVKQKFVKEMGLDEAYFKNYLDKFVQVPIYVPEQDPDVMRNYVGEKLLADEDVFSTTERKEFSGLAEFIAGVAGQNPRNAVRFINQVLVVKRISDAEKANIPAAHLAFGCLLHEIRHVLLEMHLDYEGLQAVETRGAVPEDVEEVAMLAERRFTPWMKDERLRDLPEREPFNEALARLMDLQSPRTEHQRFCRLLRALAPTQDERVRNALEWLAENVRLCRALDFPEAKDWLRHRTELEKSFRYTGAVQQPETPPEKALDFEAIIREVNETGKNVLSFPNIRESATSRHGIPAHIRPFVKDLTPLGELENATALNLSGCMGLTDLGPLGHLGKLEWLELEGCTGVTDLRPLAALKDATVLNLAGCTGVTDLAPLSRLRRIKWLYLDGCTGVTDLAPLARLTMLGRLYLMRCTGVTDLGALTRLDNLKRLNLAGCTGLADLSPLANLLNLRGLNLGGCTRIADLAPLATLGKLRWLNLAGCTGITDLRPLADLADLEVLYLVGCTRVDDLRPLARLYELRDVYARDTAVDLKTVPESLIGRLYL
ncbi:MAG TPA: hypothetical protein HPP83_10340 [Candidatus Hydrogenedentes bacterium]|nr:hypothetical protein [Candidatus Hydrogenedentota bacterium]